VNTHGGHIPKYSILNGYHTKTVKKILSG